MTSMTTDSRELKPIVERVATEIMERRAKAERTNASEDPFALLLCRNFCWTGAALSFVFAFGLSCLRWADAVIPAVGVIHWFVAGMGASFLGAVTLQVTINQRRTAAGQRRITERMDAAAVKLREEIHDARPADAIELARIVAHLQAIEALIRNLVDRLITAGDEAFVDALSDEEDGQKVNGHKVTRLIRPRGDRDRRG